MFAKPPGKESTPCLFKPNSLKAFTLTISTSSSVFELSLAYSQNVRQKGFISV